MADEIGKNGNGNKENGKNGSENGTEESDKCEPKEKPKRDIRKMLEDCQKGSDFHKKKAAQEESQCCSWHKYVLYAIPLALYLPWLIRVAKCPPRCCPPRYCCPSEEPPCPPPQLSCSPRATGCPRTCPPSEPPEPCPTKCADKTENKPECK